MKKRMLLCIIALSVAILLPQVALADSHEDYAKQLANPIAPLISVPFEADYDDDINTNDKGSTWTINVKPIIPININKDWVVISRSIVPIITQNDIPSNGAGKFGIGDVLQSFFFSPKEKAFGHLIWGVGPALLLNTASNDALGSSKWSAGPTGVALIQEGSWTLGVLANHVWSYAGNNSTSNVSSTFLQPFLTYITKSKTSYSIRTESTYDWKAEEWAVPLIFKVEQMLKLGGQNLQLGAGLRYWADSPGDGPEGLGARISLTFLFPEKERGKTDKKEEIVEAEEEALE